jgi:hypothetical protein
LAFQLTNRYLSLPEYEEREDEITRDHLGIALQSLDRISVVGLTDFYGVSLCLLLYRLGFVEKFQRACRCDVQFAINNNEGARPSHKIYKRVATFQFPYSSLREVI